MDNEKFADSGEFEGYGANPAEPRDPEPAPAADAPLKGEEKPGEASETGEQETGEARGDAAPQEETDPLDMPITDFGKVDLGIGDAPVDKVVLEAFGKTCADLKLSARQAAGLAQFQLKAIAEARERLGQEAAQTLQKSWGKDAQDNQRKIIGLVGEVDKLTGGKFSQAIEDSGVAVYADFAEGMLRIASMLGENGLGNITRQGGGARPETAEEGLREVFAGRR